MSSRSVSIDPDWAWSEYKPSAENPWDRRTAAHLFRRSGFAATREQLDTAVKQSPGEMVDRLLNVVEPAEFRQEMTDLAQVSLATGNVNALSAWWAYRMLTTPVPLLEKMTLFWHSHFATSAAKVQDPELMLAQNALLRENALGDFSKLLLEISRDPAMLVYLDSATNRKAHPNENYAREIMELFCLGEGNYTESDIRELARCFTGWEIRRNQFRFNSYQHDEGQKTIFGRTGGFDGQDGVKIVTEQESAPRFVVRKLVQFLVMDEPIASNELVDPLARSFREGGMQIRPIVQRILGSQLFYSSQARARKIRSPIEFAIGFLRSLDGSTDSYELAEAVGRLGQKLLYPPSVKGWDGGKTWINSSTLLGRSNLIRSFLYTDKTRFGRQFGKQVLPDYLKSRGISSASELIDWFETTLCAVRIPEPARNSVTEIFANAKSESDQPLKSALHILCTLPEFQLC